MKPINVLRSFLTRATTSMSDEIDEESMSPSGSWLLLSHSTKDNVIPIQASTADRSCQTQQNSPVTSPTPRSTISSLDLHSGKGALSPPVFLPKSRLPRLHYGGFQTPDLHCFTSSLSPTETPATRDTTRFLQPTAKSLPSPATFRKATAALQSTIQKDEMEAVRARSLLVDIFCEIGFASKLFAEIHTSAFVEHINRIADSLGTGGFLMYIQVWNHVPVSFLCPR